MYHLTCPSCEQVTESPFVRNGAVVRCAACEQKYRIKSAHFERLLHTGPRTLDESDSLLRSDSVDIEPDEVSPVSIDDEGNVVGLSGLSELMRWSDDQGKTKQSSNGKARGKKPQEVLNDRLKAELPEAKTAKSSSRASETADGVESARLRARRARRKRKQMTLLLLTATLGIIVGGGVVILLLQPKDNDGAGDENPLAGDQDPVPPKEGGNPDNNSVVDDPNDPETTDPTPDPGPLVRDPGDDPSVDPDPDPDPVVIADPDPDPGPVEVPDPDEDVLPTELPTLFADATRIRHEGWYVLDPPRAPSKILSDTEVSMKGMLTPGPGRDGEVILTGTVQNRSDKSVVQGELHVTLLDAQGRVFAETYLPVLGVDTKSEREVKLAIAGRHWDRAKSMQSGMQVMEWAGKLELMPDVQVNVAGAGAGMAVRVSAKHKGEDTINGAMIRLKALDNRGAMVAQFLVKQQALTVEPGEWLDVIVPTPLEEGLDIEKWTAQVCPR